MTCPWLTLLVLLAVTAGGSGGLAADTGDPPHDKDNVVLAPGCEEETSLLDSQVLSTLSTLPHPMIGVVRCERIEVQFPGSQSETLVIHGTVIHAGVGTMRGPCRFRGFASEALKMMPGRLYLAAAYGPARKELVLLQRVEVAHDTAEELLTSAIKEFKAHGPPNP